MMISYAQNFEDVILWRVFKNVERGRYVDVGAFHPEIDSVTKWFYDNGWSGINIEPVAQSFDLLQKERPRDRNICAAAGAQAGTAEITIFPESAGLSSLQPQPLLLSKSHHSMQVKMLPLREILSAEPREAIHFLKIDAEGFEGDVLRGMDFARVRPWVVVVEATGPLTPGRTSQAWQHILLENDYRFVYFDGLNEFFLAAEHKELEDRFQAPPNVFDEFEPATSVRERQRRAQAEASFNSHIAALHEERTVLRTELASSRAALTKLTADMAELSQALRKSQDTVEVIFRSRSWRWLAPIRNFNFWVRSYRKHLRVARLFR